MQWNILLFLFFIAFTITFVSIPIYIRKFIKNGFVVPDKYKIDRNVPTLGGMAILGGILVALVVAIFLINDVQKYLIFYFIVFTFATFGLLDDLVNVGRILKIFAPFFMALPIALLCTSTTVSTLIFGNVDFGYLFPFLIAPLFVMVVSNLVNMHSGYNGLQSGLSIIVISFVTIAALLTHHTYEDIIYIVPLYGALVAFFLYNRYPARIFEGNVGSLATGAAIGGYVILLGNLEYYAIILLIPHIINFSMYVYWCIMKIDAVKFGRLREDGTIEVPNPLTLKWVLPYFRRTTEVQATYAMYAITAVFGVAGLFIL